LPRQEVAAHCRQVFLASLHRVDERRHPVRGDFPWTARHAMRRVDELIDLLVAVRVVRSERA